MTGRDDTTTYESFVDAKDATLCQFAADGFRQPVPGVVYRAGRLARGIPLGGLGTGYVELTGRGRVGDVTICNDFPAAYTWEEPLRLDAPLLAVGLGSAVRVLAMPLEAADERAELGSALLASDICYWGHYPFAELDFVTDLPLDVRLRAWCPFVPGDAELSNSPLAFLELSLTNRDATPVDVHVALACPGFPVVEDAVYRRARLKGSATGVATTTEHYGRDVGYALGILSGADDVEVGAQIGTPSQTWSKFTEGLAEPSDREPGSTISGRVSLGPGERKTIVFTLVWYYPDHQVGGAFPYHHMYGRRYEDIGAVVEFGRDRFLELRERTLGWQRAVYGQDLPPFLRDALINSLYCLAKNSWWNYAPGTDDVWGPDGLFTLNETFRDCPVTETVPCRFFGHYPALLLFPELEKTTLHALANYQLSTGELPFALAYGSGLYDPRYHCVHPLNSAMFVQMLYRYYLRTGDAAFLRSMFPAVKAAVAFLQSLDDDADGLVNEHPHALPGTPWPANNYHDTFQWHGTSIYTAGVWLATLRTAAAMATLVRDEAYAGLSEEWLLRGRQAIEEKLWTGDQYLVYSDPENDRCLEASLLNQLVGEWCIAQLGLSGVLAEEHVEKAVEAILRQNVALGAVVPIDTVDRSGRAYAQPEMEIDPAARQSAACMVSEAICFAMTLLWRGRQSEGLGIVEAIWKAHAITHRTPFSQYYLIDPQDGAPIWGNDYYSNMITWAVPMALGGQNIAEYALGSLIRLCVEGPAH
jgi:uncharacterized protein (DUF608 family)